MDLINAIKDQDYPKVKFLLEKGADINFRTPQKDTPLSTAIIKNDYKITKLLIDKGADLNAKDNRGDTVLMIAIDKSKYKIAKLLIDKGANVNAKDNEGDTVLMYAAVKTDYEIAKMLIDRGANVNAKNNEDKTVLMHAADKGYYQIVKLLVDKGVNVNAKNKEGKSALIFAVDEGKTYIVELLIDNGADVNAKTKLGNTALMYAAYRNNYEIVKLLIDNGAYINSKNNKGESAFYVAKQKRYNEIADFLSKHVENITKRIKGEAQEKRLVYKWQPICKSLGDKDLSELRNLAKLDKIASADSKSKRVLCKELAEKYERKMNKPLQCENDSTIGGDDINDVPRPLLYRLKEGYKVFCFNILELLKLDKNPYTRNELPKKDINEKYEKLERLLVKSKLSQTLLDQIKEMGVLSKSKDALMTLKITNILSKLKYPKSVEYFKSLKSSQLEKLMSGLSEYELMRISSSEVEKVKESKDKLNTLVTIVSQKLEIQDSNSETRRVIFEDVFNNLDNKLSIRGSSSPRGSSSLRGSSSPRGSR